jgi:ribonuclease P protein component
VLPVARRVRRREDFTTTLRAGRRAVAPGLVGYLSSGSAAGPARAGFVVGRAVGPSVRRNRVKRQLRHLIAPRLADLPEGSVLVVRATAGAAHSNGAQLASALDAVLASLAMPATAAVRS